MQAQKPTLEDLRLEARLSIAELSRRSRVDMKTIRRALDGTRVQKLKAFAIVDVIAEALHRPLKLEDIEGLNYI